VSAEPEFDCIDCLQRAEEAAQDAFLGWPGVVDYYREFRENCSDFPDSVGVAPTEEQ
jgi:hypothetical protein